MHRVQKNQLDSRLVSLCIIEANIYMEYMSGTVVAFFVKITFYSNDVFGKNIDKEYFLTYRTNICYIRDEQYS